MLIALEFAVLFLAMIAVASRRTGLEDKALWSRPPTAAVALWLSVAIASGLQFVVSGWLEALRRDPDEILHHGQVWRLLTSMFVQDGGVAGTLFNLAILALAAVPAARYFGGRTMWAIFLGGGVAFNLLGALFDSSGAGNSGATVGLACALVGHTAIVGLVRRGSVAPKTMALAVLPLLVGIAAWRFFDYHGEAEVVGWCLGALLGFVVPKRFPVERAALAEAVA